MILLAAASFAAFGESVIALKLGALAFGTATLVALYALGRIWFSRAAGAVAGLGYLTGPPLVAHGALLTMGSHGESALFSLLQLHVFFGLLSGSRRSPRAFGLLGLVSGLGLWFCYTSGLSLLACGLVWLWLEGLPRPRELAFALAGGALGLAPWLVYNLGHDFVGLERVLELFGRGDPIDPWIAQGPLDKLRALAGRDLYFGLVFPLGSEDPPVLVVAVLAAFFVPLLLALAAGFASALSGLRRGAASADAAQDRRLLVLVTYVGVFLAAFLFSEFTIDLGQLAHGFRLFLPLAVILGFIASVAGARLLSRGGFDRGVAALGLSLYLLASSAASFTLASFRWDVFDLKEGDGHFVRGVLVHRKTEPRFDRAVEAARRLQDPLHRYRTFEGIGFGLQYRFEGGGDLGRVRRNLAMLRVEERGALLRGLLEGVAERTDELKQRAELGDHPREHRAARRRLLRLAGAVRADWEKIPEELRQPRGEDRTLVRSLPREPEPASGE